MDTLQADSSRPHVVIIGGGFGGLKAARSLRKVAVRVTLIDRRNFHLFQPLLYQVATGALSPANIATPLRFILRKQKNCEVLLAEVTGFDIEQKQVLLRDGTLKYDNLILAAGASHSYFGRDDWEPLAPGLKTIEDATEIRKRIFVAFEAAERESDPTQRAALMTFVIVGGGPTGVELAGALAEIAHHTLAHDFRNIAPSEAKILLVEAAPHLLAHFPEDLSKRAADKIRKLGIEIRTNTKVIDIQPDHVKLQTSAGIEELPTHTVLWGAGVQANPLGTQLAKVTGVECDRAGRIPVEATLSVANYPHVYVIGDIASCLGANGKPLPGLAPVAMQQGEFVAKRIDAQLRGRTSADSFVYSDWGSMATIGRAVAVVQIGKHQFCGFFAWLMWLFVHLMQIAQFQNRILVLFQWMWSFFTYNRSARLITNVIRDENPQTITQSVDLTPEETKHE